MDELIEQTAILHDIKSALESHIVADFNKGKNFILIVSILNVI